MTVSPVTQVLIPDDLIPAMLSLKMSFSHEDTGLCGAERQFSAQAVMLGVEFGLVLKRAADVPGRARPGQATVGGSLRQHRSDSLAVECPQFVKEGGTHSSSAVNVLKVNGNIFLFFPSQFFSLPLFKRDVW